MHPRTAELLAYLEQEMDTLKAVYESVPAAKRGVRPEPGRWSAAEVIHHLTIVDRRLIARLTQLVEQARALPPEGDATPILRQTAAGRVITRDQRFVTSEMAEPRDTDVARVWDDYAHVRAALVGLILQSEGLALGGVSAPHPVLGSFTGYDWIAFAGAHAARHADQIREFAASWPV